MNTMLMMVNNGKFCNNGMIMNPYAVINDGLIDISWVDAPEYQGTLSVSGIMSRARMGGIQAYEGHSQYIRGRKVQIDVPEPAIEQPELELADENGAAAAEQQTSQRADRVIMIDGEALNYRTTVIWECFPSNVEILIDDSIF